jgi:hypothetical protein
VGTADTNPWFEMIVPLTTFGSTTTSNVTVTVAPTAIEPSGKAADERGQPPTSATGRAIERRAPGDVNGVDRHRVAQHDARRGTVPRVSHRDRVAERLAGERDVRVAGEIVEIFCTTNAGLRRDQHPRRSSSPQHGSACVDVRIVESATASRSLRRRIAWSATTVRSQGSGSVTSKLDDDLSGVPAG